VRLELILDELPDVERALAEALYEKGLPDQLLGLVAEDAFPVFLHRVAVFTVNAWRKRPSSVFM
jgi:hypothetical protein